MARSKEIDLSELAESPNKPRSNFFHNLRANNAREINWYNVLYESINDETVFLACLLLDTLWPDGFIFGPGSLEA